MIENEFLKQDLDEKELAILDREFNYLKKDINVAYLLLVFTGIFGIHKFYLGKIGMGILYFCTGGLALFGVIYDLVTLPQQVHAFNTSLDYDLVQRMLKIKQSRKTD